MSEAGAMKVIVFALCVSACVGSASARLGDRLPPEAYIDPIDQQIARSGVGLPDRPIPCGHLRIQNGVRLVERRPTDQCVVMDKAKRWKGLWRRAFEGSQFCPKPATTCGRVVDGDRIWLSKGPGKGSYGGKLYRIEFVGRKTKFKGEYGHFGMYDQEIFVDRVIKLEEVPEADRK